MSAAKEGRPGVFRRGAVSSSLLNVASQAVAFAVGVVLAFRFGAQASTDVYYFGLSVVTLLANFITSFNAAVLIPEAMRRREREGPAAAMRFLNLYLAMVLVVAGLLGAAAAIDPVACFGVLSRFPPGVLGGHGAILRWCAPLLVLLVTSQFLLDVLFAWRMFTAPMLAGLVSRLLLLAVALGAHEAGGMAAMMAAWVAGAAIQAVAAAVLLRRAYGWSFSIRGVRLDRTTVWNVGITIAATFVSLLAGYVPVYLLSGVTAGVITAMNYARQLAASPTMVVTTQVAAVAGVKFNEVLVRGNWAEANRSFRATADVLIHGLFPVTLLLATQAHAVVTVCFARGSFDAGSAAQCATFLGYLALGIVPAAVVAMSARILIALQRIQDGFVYQVSVNLAMVAAMTAGMGVRGVEGMLAGQLVVQWLNVPAMYLFLRRLAPQLDYGMTLRSLAEAAAVNLIPALLAAGCVMLLTDRSPWLSLLLATGAYGAAWLPLVWLAPSGRRAFAQLLPRAWGTRA